ncbi:MAG: DUF4143 domain-containing protein [Propionibacteriaceae bacterium]|jgi:predicted AAA+ superfamily ATPase|nr:DUF4143 domain-containing protein [Propionibacteriaceae bacterium]
MSAVDQSYRPRCLDRRLSLFLRAFGAVLIEGPKWCGKTWMGRRHSSSAIYLDDPPTRLRSSLDPRGVLAGSRPTLIDEWQDAPVLWDVARRMVDESPSKGLFIFTGSASPAQSAVSHSGTGRFARLRLRPMSLFESGQSSGAVTLSGLLAGDPIEPVASDLDYQGIIKLICRGGWPSSLGLDDDLAALAPQQYLEALANSDLPQPDRVRRDPDKVRALLRSLARHTSTSANFDTVRADIADQSELDSIPAKSTLWSYLAALRGVFAVDDLPPWVYSLRSKSQLRMAPTRHLADPSLAAAALSATPESLHQDPQTTGLLFESLVVRDLRVYAEAQGGSVAHYRDNKGLEADAIVTSADGRWGAVEVKLGAGQLESAADNLRRLRRKLADEVRQPSFLAVVTATSGLAHTRDDGVHVVPIDCLGPGPAADQG